MTRRTMPTPLDNTSPMDVGDSTMTLSSSSSTDPSAMTLTAHSSSSSVPSSQSSAIITAVTDEHRPDDGDVAMANTNNDNSSTSPNQTNITNVNDDDDVQMAPQEDVAVTPMENSTDLESSPASSAPPEQSAIPGESNPPIVDNERKDPEEVSLDDSMEEQYLTHDDEMTDSVKLDVPLSLPSTEQNNRLDQTLDKLQHSISVAILAFRKEEQGTENIRNGSGGASNDCNAYVTLREAAVDAYQSLVEYGSSLDLSLTSNGNSDSAHMNKRRREKLEKIGRDLWKSIRANPDLFNDVISDVTTSNFGIATSSSLEQRRQRAIAGGYIRTIAVRLIFLAYIDTRCSRGCPPALHERRDGNKAHNPSPKELVFGLKVLSKGGRAILQHGKNARDSHDTLSLATSCFNALSGMVQSNGEAANELKDVLDEAFDVFLALPNAAALFETEQADVDRRSKEDDASVQADSVSVDWPTIVLKQLDAATNFIDEHCNAALKEDSKSPLKYAALQRFLPQLARLCLKQGSHFADIGMNEHAMKALHIDLTVTNSCLQRIKEEKTRTQEKNEATMLQNLEANVVLVSIDSLYVLSAVLQTLGRKQDAINCLDEVEKHMTEKYELDEELYEETMNALSNGKDFLFTEDAIGPAQDKKDFKNRATTTRTKGFNAQSREKATLSSRRIKLHNENPSQEDERCIDKQLRSMVELVSKRQETSLMERSFENDQILVLTLQAIRSVHVRRKMSRTSDEGGVALDPYRLMFDQLSKSHQLRPFVVLDKLSATLSIAFEVRQRKLENEYQSIDQEAIILADQCLSSFKRGDALNSDTTLFVDTKNLMKKELFDEAKVQFSRAVSLYHSYKAYEMCAKWASLLKDVLETCKGSAEHGDDPILAGVLTVLAYSLSMSGSHAEGMKMVREAWKKQKSVDNLVIHFHCATLHEHADALLELDNALNELSTSDHDNILEHFPRLSNSCVENEAEGGELLLGVQERWMNLLLRSKKLSTSLEQKVACESPSGHSVLDLLCAYLDNFECVISSQKDRQKAESMCEYLGHIIDGVLRLLQVCRDRKQEKLIGRRKKKKTPKETSEDGFDLIWNDTTTVTLLGERSQCVWVAEALWNIGHQLYAARMLENVSYDSSAVAADLFAASHDFILMSEEEEGARLSKLDYDVKYEPEKFSVPSFNGASTTAASDISSEFSAQCLLLSAAVAVDYYMEEISHIGIGDQSSTKSLLRRTLHRLAQSQQEFELNCKKRAKVSKMIALLTMRCVLGIGEDSFAFQTFNNGLSATLLKLHLNDAAASNKEFYTLRQVKLMCDMALEKRMTHTDRVLTKMVSEMLQKSGDFQVIIGGCFISLGDLQRKTIQSASSVDDAIGVFQEVDNVIKKEKGGIKKMYSVDEFSWFAIEAYNKFVQLSTIGDDDNAKTCLTYALNFVEFSSKEVRCSKRQMLTSFSASCRNWIE